MSATSCEFSFACANAGSTATCAMLPSPTTAQRTLRVLLASMPERKAKGMPTLAESLLHDLHHEAHVFRHGRADGARGMLEARRQDHADLRENRFDDDAERERRARRGAE